MFQARVKHEKIDSEFGKMWVFPGEGLVSEKILNFCKQALFVLVVLIVRIYAHRWNLSISLSTCPTNSTFHFDLHNFGKRNRYIVVNNAFATTAAISGGFDNDSYGLRSRVHDWIFYHNSYYIKIIPEISQPLPSYYIRNELFWRPPVSLICNDRIQDGPGRKVMAGATRKPNQLSVIWFLSICRTQWYPPL